MLFRHCYACIYICIYWICSASVSFLHIYFRWYIHISISYLSFFARLSLSVCDFSSVPVPKIASHQLPSSLGYRFSNSRLPWLFFSLLDVLFCLRIVSLFLILLIGWQILFGCSFRRTVCVRLCAGPYVCSSHNRKGCRALSFRVRTWNCTGDLHSCE